MKQSEALITQNCFLWSLYLFEQLLDVLCILGVIFLNPLSNYHFRLIFGEIFFICFALILSLIIKKSIFQDKRQKILNKHGRSWEFLEGGSKSSKMSSPWLADEESLRLGNSLKGKFQTLLNEVSSTLSCLFSEDNFSCKVLRRYRVTNVLFVKKVLSIPCIHYKLMKLNFTFVKYFC